MARKSTQVAPVTQAEVLGVSDEFLSGAEAGFALRQSIIEKKEKAKALKDAATDKFCGKAEVAKGFIAALFMREGKAPKVAKERVIPEHVLKLLSGER
jgi:hypothetical protein